MDLYHWLFYKYGTIPLYKMGYIVYSVKNNIKIIHLQADHVNEHTMIKNEKDNHVVYIIILNNSPPS